MESSVILLDTTILIDFFRRKNKANSEFYKLSGRFKNFAVSTITRFEIFVGNNEEQNIFWKAFYKNIEILDFNDNCAFEASEIVKQLRLNNQMIETIDILIAATAIANKIPVATLNKKHFERVKNLDII